MDKSFADLVGGFTKPNGKPTVTPEDMPNDFIVPDREMIVQQLILGNAYPDREAAEKAVDVAKSAVDAAINAFNKAVYDALDANSNGTQLSLLSLSFLKKESEDMLNDAVALTTLMGGKLTNAAR